MTYSIQKQQIQPCNAGLLSSEEIFTLRTCDGDDIKGDGWHEIVSKWYLCIVPFVWRLNKQDVTGFSDIRRMIQRVSEHESSQPHTQHTCSAWYAREVWSLLSLSKRKCFAKLKTGNIKLIQIISKLTNKIKILRKQVLPFRGHRNDAACSMDSETQNHGNFLARYSW